MRSTPRRSAPRIWRMSGCVEQADLAEFFFEIRGQDALIQIYTQTVAADQKALDYNQAQYDTGVGDQLSVVEARATLQAAQSSLTNLGILRAQYEHAIAVLIGKPASGFSLPARPILTAPPPVPVGMPSLLLQRRPDVAAAERTMAAANAELGVAYTAFFPTLTLSASGGFDSYLFKHLAGLAQPLLVGWSILLATHLQRGLKARSSISTSRFTTRTLPATGRRSSLPSSRSKTICRRRVSFRSRSSSSAARLRRRKRLSIWRWAGTRPASILIIDVVTLQNTVLSNQQQLASLQIEQMTGAVQLVQALGGGWDASQLPTPTQVTAAPSKADTKIQQ